MSSEIRNWALAARLSAFAALMIGFPVVGPLLGVIATVVAAVNASNGRPYRYPLTVRFVS